MPITDKNKLDNIEYRQLSPEEIPDSLLINFGRQQETHRVLAMVNGQLIEKEDHFIDVWDESRLIEVAGELRDCAQAGGIVLGAFETKKCIGFSSILPDRFGSRDQYCELTLCHVTEELRGKGIGREIFRRICAIAKSKNTEKLYLSTHPSIETQAFYRAMGCVLAEEVNPEILSREPLDIQLEKSL